jgi:predicted glycosyltransferase
MRVMILVTHLLGTGHLSRAATLARAFVAGGHSVDLLSGGTVVGNLDYQGMALHQLPPVKSDGVNFTCLLDENGGPVDETYLENRRRIACGLVEHCAPDVLITELYPFGRRILRHEFQAVLDTAHALPHKPLMLCSIRDILAPPSRPEKVARTEAIIMQDYDAVLVHSDQSLMPLETSWPMSAALAERLAYTGFVAPPPPAPHPDRLGKGEVLVTAGGGGVGADLFTIAVQAAKQDSRHWHLLVGGSEATNEITRLQKLAGNTAITIEPTRPDFRQMLPHAGAAVAMCGYNTAMDLLQTGTPAVFIPFDAGGEVEQTLRANRLAASEQFDVVTAASLTPAKLLAALDKVKRQAPPPMQNFDGARQTVRIVERMRQ